MASYAYSKQWKGKDGQDYFLWSGADNLKPYYGEPVYSYNQVMDMLKAAKEKLHYGDKEGKLYKAIYKSIYNTREKLDKVGISYDEPLFTESQMQGLKDPLITAIKVSGGSNTGRPRAENIQREANKLGTSIMTKDEWTAYTRPDSVAQFMKYALPAAGLALATAGMGGLLGGVGSSGGAAAAGGAGATGGAVATAMPVTTTSAAGITTSALSPLATGGGLATAGGTGLAMGGGTGLSVGGGTGLTTTGATFGGSGLATSTGSGLATSTGSGLGLKMGGGLGLKMGGGLGLKATLPEVAMSGGGFFSKLGGFLGDAFGGPFGRLITNIAGGWLADKYTDGPFDGYNIDPGRIDDYMRKAEDAIRLATERNEELFNYRFGKAKQLIDEESGYFNPDYFAQQSMARARNMNAAARKEGLRGVTGDAAANLSRKYDLDAVRGMGTAYDSGYATGVQGRLQTMTTGLQFLPTDYPNYSRDYAALAGPYMDLERLKMDMAKDNWAAKHRNAAGIGKWGGDALDWGKDIFGWAGNAADKVVDTIGGWFD